MTTEQKPITIPPDALGYLTKEDRGRMLLMISMSSVYNEARRLTEMVESLKTGSNIETLRPRIMATREKLLEICDDLSVIEAGKA